MAFKLTWVKGAVRKQLHSHKMKTLHVCNGIYYAWEEHTNACQFAQQKNSSNAKRFLWRTNLHPTLLPIKTRFV